jgi:hypothetical protein
VVLAGRAYDFPPLVTVWHREPRGRDSGTVCRNPKAQRWHIHHWKLQVHPLQEARRWLLTRCTWCGGPHRRNDPVNVSGSWSRPRTPWWRGEVGLYHLDCHSISRAHDTCLCPRPRPEHGDYGWCALCGKFRPFGLKEEQLRRMKLLTTIPPGQRDREIYGRYCELARSEQAVVAEAERIVRAAAGGTDV